MTYIKTSKGNVYFTQRMPNVKEKPLHYDSAHEALQVISVFLDKIGINWGPAFGTLIGIVRNNGFLPWARHIDLYILREDEERFKDILWMMLEHEFVLERYERRGIYVLTYHGVSIVIYLFRKIAYDIRHSGGRDFILEKYIQNTTKWDFDGISLNVPSDLDEYLSSQYGDWLTPINTTHEFGNSIQRAIFKMVTWIKDRLPNSIYYLMLLKYHQAHFEEFKARCSKQSVKIANSIELSYDKPRKGKKVLTVGVYDLIHKGHVELFRRAKGLGDHLTVAVQDGDMILKFKPQAKVLNSTEDRVYMVQSVRYVDETVVYTSVDDIVQHVDFDIFVSGPDQCHDGFQRAIRWCQEHGKESIILGRTNGVSSSELKAKIAEKQKNR